MTDSRSITLNRIKLRKVGLISKYIDNTSNDCLSVIEAYKNRIPFSKNYATYEDYTKDCDRAFDIAYECKDIPDELYNKLRETAEELGLTW